MKDRDDSQPQFMKVSSAIEAMRIVRNALSDERWARLTEQQLLLLCLQSAKEPVNAGFVYRIIQEIEA